MNDYRQLYNDWKKRLDVRQILAYYNAQNVSEIVSADGTTELVHSCLLDRIEPHHANGDIHPSAWANCEKGLYCCAVYWAGDIFHLIQKLERAESLSTVMPVIGDFLVGASRSIELLSKEIETMLDEPVYSLDLPSYSERVLDPWMKSHPWMRDVRGITQEAHEYLRIGYDDKENRITFPHFWKDRLVGWQKRSIPTSGWKNGVYWSTDRWTATMPDFPKYKSSSGFPKSETLYNYVMIPRMRNRARVVVVESPMSVAKAASFNIYNVVATFGAKVSQHQIDLLKDYAEVTVWFDDDVAGHAGERKLVEGLYRHTDVRVVSPDKDQDLGDLQSTDQILEKIEAAKPAALWLDDQDTP